MDLSVFKNFVPSQSSVHMDRRGVLKVFPTVKERESPDPTDTGGLALKN